MDAMNKWWIYNVLVLKIIKFLFKHRQSIGKVKLYSNVAGLRRKVYRGIAALLQKVAVNRPFPNYRLAYSSKRVLVLTFHMKISFPPHANDN